MQRHIGIPNKILGDRKKKNIAEETRELLDSKEKDITHVSMPICYFPKKKSFFRWKSNNFI